jgi:hypothetical protein
MNPAVTQGILNATSLEELKTYNQLIKQRWNALQRGATVFFDIGQKVKFASKHGMTITGTIEKINQKTIVVRNDANPLQVWKVAPSLLNMA